MGSSYAMNAKLTTGYALASPGSFLLNQIYSSRANQRETYYQILGNKNFIKRIYLFQKYGTGSYGACR
jgi:hypothetical protein